MNAKPGSGRLKRHQFAIAIVLLAALLLPAIPARAIIGIEETDSDQPYQYPSVGTIWTTITCCFDPDEDNPEPDHQHYTPIPLDDDGELFVRASGILVAPNVVLTVADAFPRDGRRVAVSFESPVADFEDYYDPDGNPDGTVFEGYIFKHPEFGGWKDFPGSYSHENNFDMAVVVLDHAVPNEKVEPTSVAGLGALDALKGATGKKEPLTAVGYGTTNYRGGNQDWTWDFARRSAAWELSGLKQSLVHTTSPGQHGPCDGDHGGPILTDNPRAVAGLIVNWDGICGAKGVGLGYRTDTADAHALLCNVGSQVENEQGEFADWVDEQGVQNANYPLLGDPGDLDYPSVAPSADTLADYCHGGASAAKSAASGDDGGEQSADRAQQGNGKHKHKNGGGKHRGKGKRGR